MERKELHFSEFKGFVFDVDGVLKIGHTPIEGAADVVEFLQSEGKKVAILTNSATRTRKDIVDLLKGIGIKITVMDAFGSAYGTAKYMKEKFGKRKVFVIGERGLIEELTNVGMTVLPIEKALDAEFVVVGIDRGFNYEKLTAALRALKKGARFIATNEDASDLHEDGLVPGAGSMVAALSFCSKMKPEIIVGKPHPFLLELAIKSMGLRKDEVAFFGDTLETDIACAKNAEVFSVLVLTGNTPYEVEPLKLPPEHRPSAILTSIKKLPARW